VLPKPRPVLTATPAVSAPPLHLQSAQSATLVSTQLHPRPQCVSLASWASTLSRDRLLAFPVLLDPILACLVLSVSHVSLESTLVLVLRHARSVQLASTSHPQEAPDASYVTLATSCHPPVLRPAQPVATAHTLCGQVHSCALTADPELTPLYPVAAIAPSARREPTASTQAPRGAIAARRERHHQSPALRLAPFVPLESMQERSHMSARLAFLERTRRKALLICAHRASQAHSACLVLKRAPAALRASTSPRPDSPRVFQRTPASIRQRELTRCLHATLASSPPSRTVLSARSAPLGITVRSQQVLHVIGATMASIRLKWGALSVTIVLLGLWPWRAALHAVAVSLAHMPRMMARSAIRACLVPTSPQWPR
jgi:hypothetical protein